VGCADSQVDTTQNVCYVVTGATTLYYPFDTQSIESILANTTEGITDEEFTQAQENNAVLITTRSQARVAIREAINDGFYTTADPSIAAVHYRSTLPPPVRETRDGDTGGSLPWWVWVLIVVAIVLFNLCLLIGWVLYRQRQQGQIGIDDGDESNKYFNSEQPFNDLEDQSEPNEDDIMDINTQQPSLDQQRQDLFGRQGATGQQQQGTMSSSSESVSGSESESDDSEGSSVDTNELLESSDSDESSSSGEVRPQGGGGRKR